MKVNLHCTTRALDQTVGLCPGTSPLEKVLKLFCGKYPGPGTEQKPKDQLGDGAILLVSPVPSPTGLRSYTSSTNIPAPEDPTQDNTHFSWVSSPSNRLTTIITTTPTTPTHQELIPRAVYRRPSPSGSDCAVLSVPPHHCKNKPNSLAWYSVPCLPLQPMPRLYPPAVSTLPFHAFKPLHIRLPL